MNETARAADVRVCRSWTARNGSDSKSEHHENVSALFRVRAPECDRNVQDTELQVAFMKYGYLMGRCTSTIENVNSGKRFIEEPFKYEMRVLRVFDKVRFRSSGDKRSRFLLASGGEEESRGLRAAKVLLLFSIRIRGIIESQDYSFSQYIYMARPIDTVDETLRRVHLRSSTDDEVDCSLRRGTVISKQGDLSVREFFEMERLETLQGCVDVLRANHANAIFEEDFAAIAAFLTAQVYRDC